MSDLLGTADLDLLRAIFETLPDCPFFVKNSELRYVAANQAMARMCGVSRAAELHGHRASRFFPTALVFRYEALDRQVLETGLPIRHRLHRSVASSEEPVWLLFSRTPIFDQAGNTVGVIASARRLKDADDDTSTYHRLARVADRIDREFDQPLRVRELASLSGVSVSQLERDFVRLFGMTLSQYLHHARISHALLKLDEGLSISAIAYECGYTDHSAFTRRFRKAVGSSPREYRSTSSPRTGNASIQDPRPKREHKHRGDALRHSQARPGGDENSLVGTSQPAETAGDARLQHKVQGFRTW